MSRLQQLLEPLRLRWARLTQREQVLWAVGGGSGLLVLGLLLLLVLGQAIGSKSRQNHSKRTKLQQIVAMQAQVRSQQMLAQQRQRQLQQSNVRLVSFVEEAARQSQVDIGQLRPDEGEVNSEGIVEARVELRAAGLSADRLADFLQRLEGQRELVFVRRLKMSRPYRRDTVDMECTVVTYKMRS